MRKKHKERGCVTRRKTSSWMKGWTVKNIEGKLNRVLQMKIWKLGEARKDNRVREQQLK